MLTTDAPRKWLDPQFTLLEDLLPGLEPYPADFFEFFKSGVPANRHKNNVPEAPEPSEMLMFHFAPGPGAE